VGCCSGSKHVCYTVVYTNIIGVEEILKNRKTEEEGRKNWDVCYKASSAPESGTIRTCITCIEVAGCTSASATFI
jgi:hypothetical protein